MAVFFNGRITGMTTAQFAALPPHKKLFDAAKLPHAGINAGPQTFHPVDGRTMGPALVAKAALNSTWLFVHTAPQSSYLCSRRMRPATFTTPWKEDPFNATWGILARAYSAIRDQVGKSNAPLDRFLALVCPELGIIAAEKYLQSMSWEREIDVDGVMKLKQKSVPDIASFDHGIQHTSMTKKDIVHLCARKSYISRSNATVIAGRPGAAQHGLLASSVPIVPIAPVAPVAPVAAISIPANNNFLLQTMINPRRAAFDVLGFDVNAILGPAEHFQSSILPYPPPPAPIQWTGCLADIYNPIEGTFNFEALTYYNNDFDIGEISDPRSFDEIFVAIIQDGSMQSTIPECGDYGMNL